ncbi:MAG: ABC transporter permease [Acidobacteria bacterium]|nr:ABC transporter permease [Acidobacteriota bacterium]
MSIPYLYSINSIRARKSSSIVAILCVSAVVCVFIAVMAMADGFSKMLETTGSEDNVIILRKGSSAEMMSIISKEQFKAIGDQECIKRDQEGNPIISGEVVVVAPFFHKSTKTYALGQVRGVKKAAFSVHQKVKITKGRSFEEGMYEFVVGKKASAMYEGLDLGKEFKLGGRIFKIVGLMESDGSLYESEIWCDLKLLDETYKRPLNIYSTVFAKLKNKNDLDAFKKAVEKDPRLNLEVKTEKAFFEEQSRVVTTMIRVLGFLVALVMAVGATFAAFNTIYSSVASRTKELATLRAIGFSALSVTSAILFESFLISFLGGFLGCIFSLPLDEFSASTLNFQSFSQLAFSFDISFSLLIKGMLFAIIIGVTAGVNPAIKATTLKPADALREN